MILPTKLSECLRLALDDLKAFEAAGHEIDMGVWHEPSESAPTICRACLAGSVMHQRMNVSRETFIHRSEFRTRWSEQDANALLALDIIRVGAIDAAIEMFEHGAVTSASDNYFEVPRFHLNRDAWFQAMEGIVIELQGRGK